MFRRPVDPLGAAHRPQQVARPRGARSQSVVRRRETYRSGNVDTFRQLIQEEPAVRRQPLAVPRTTDNGQRPTANGQRRTVFTFFRRPPAVSFTTPDPNCSQFGGKRNATQKSAPLFHAATAGGDRWSRKRPGC